MDHNLHCRYYATFGGVKLNDNNFTNFEITIKWSELAFKHMFCHNSELH